MREPPDDISPTRGILKTLGPYRPTFKEEDWTYILACLHDIEICQAKRCLVCKERMLIDKL